jgi:hypothetical protein
MPDVILLPIPDVGVLALSREQFNAALLAGREFQGLAPIPSTTAPTATTRVVSAEELQSTTGVPASWWMTAARERRIPFRKFGRRVRFNPDEVLCSEAFRRRAKE